MHLFGAGVVWVGDVDVLCVDLAKLKNVVVLVCVDMTGVRVLCMLSPGVFKPAHLDLGIVAIMLLEDGKRLLLL
eukprot:6564198-Prorocentrum_lima.AAC.1